MSRRMRVPSGPLPPNQGPVTAGPVNPAQPPINPTIAYKPTDLAIPHSLDEFLPNVELYRKLQDAERRIDLYTSRKWIDFQEFLNTANNGNNKFNKKTEILRIFVYNTVANQPWQEDSEKNGNEESSWTLRVEGRLLDGQSADSENRRKFNSFLTGISVDLIPNENYPLFESGNIVEWHDKTDQNMSYANREEFDGLDIKRNGIHNLHCKIVIQLKEIPLKLKLNDNLSRFLGIKEATQHELIFSLWQYIKLNDLQSPEDFKMINCDESLQQVFGRHSFRFNEIIDLINHSTSPKEPIVIDYEINTLKSTTLGDIIVDVPVEVADEDSHIDLNAIREYFQMSDVNLKELDNKIILGVQALNNSKSKYDFYNNLSKDPVNFWLNWAESHSNSLKILSGDDGFNEETVRRSDFYTDELVNENIDILLNTNKI